jgi:hypothetical protein
MEKVKSSDSSRLRQYISDFKDVFTSDGKVLLRQACGKSIVAQQHSQVTQNLSGSLIGESSATSSSSGPSKFATFAKDLWKGFVSADITLFKINNPEVRNFLLKYTQTDPPDESTLRKKLSTQVLRRNIEQKFKCCVGKNMFGCLQTKQLMQVDGRLQMLLLGF